MPRLTDSIGTIAVLLKEKASLAMSIGAVDQWSDALIKLTRICMDSPALRPRCHEFLDSILLLANGQRYNNWINSNIAEAIYYKSYLYLLDKNLNQQIFFGSRFFTDTTYSNCIEKERLLIKKNYLGDKLCEAYTIRGDYDKAIAIIDPIWKRISQTGNADDLVQKTFVYCNTLNKKFLPEVAIKKALPVVAIRNVSAANRASLLATLSESFIKIGDTTLAEQNILAAISLVDGAEDDIAWFTKAQCLANYASILQDKNLIDKALSIYQKSILAFYMCDISGSRDISKIYISISECYLDKYQLDSALFYNEKAIRKILDLDNAPLDYAVIKNKLFEENTIMDAFDNRAAIFKKKYAEKKDHKYLEEIIDAANIGFSEQWIILSSFDFSSSLDNENENGRRRSQMAIDACFQLLDSTHDPKWSLMAFAMAEKSKAIILQQTLIRQLAFENLGDDALLLKNQMLESKIAALGDTVNGQLGNHDSLDIIKKHLNEQLSNNQALLDLKYPNLKTALGREDGFDVKSITQKLLGDKSMLVEYFIGDSVNYVFGITKNGQMLMEKLSGSAITITSHFQQYFTDKNAISNHFGDYCNDAWSLYQQLFPSKLRLALADPSIDRLILITDGSLSFVPFDALLTAPVAINARTAAIPYLINRFVVSNGYSALSLLLRQSHREMGNSAVFAPIFSQQQRGLATLKYSGDEADIAARSISGGEAYLQDKATLQNFTKVLPSLSLIHLATHASAGATGSPRIEFYDSSLTLDRIYTLPVNANLVVLSACQTGIGKLQTGEGPLSLARGFYCAGARQVITSLWNVDDKSNAAIFQNFYMQPWQQLTSTALQKAKLEYLKNADETKASPYYWAGMVIFGVDENVYAQPSYAWIWVSLAVLIAIVFSFYLIKYKKFRPN